MIKIKIGLFVNIVSLCILAACSRETELHNIPNTIPNTEIAIIVPTNTNQTENIETPVNTNEIMSGDVDVDVDVDLTKLSSTMVYAEVYNMMMIPQDYIGKKIKMQGAYYSEFVEATQQYYNFVIISDATACCAQGLEFVWIGEHKYPDDYPQNQSKIEITGVFESYKEGDQTYYHLETDNIKVL